MFIKLFWAMKTKNKTKLPYIAPCITATIIEMEEGVASGSAATNPGNNSDEVKDQWDTGSDDNRSVQW